jgi:hypothetical protein
VRASNALYIFNLTSGAPHYSNGASCQSPAFFTTNTIIPKLRFSYQLHNTMELETPYSQTIYCNPNFKSGQRCGTGKFKSPICRWGLDTRLMTLLCKNIYCCKIQRSEHWKTNLVESSNERYGSIRAVLPMMMTMICRWLKFKLVLSIFLVYYDYKYTVKIFTLSVWKKQIYMKNIPGSTVITIPGSRGTLRGMRAVSCTSMPR